VNLCSLFVYIEHNGDESSKGYMRVDLEFRSFLTSQFRSQ